MSIHQKRISAPKSWMISRKSNKWITATNPGPHSKKFSIPLIVVVRDMLKIVDTRKEAKRILSEGKIFVNGIVRKDVKFPIGLFDLLTIPLENQAYRALFDRKGRLTLHKLKNLDENLLARINGKTTVKEGKTQLNLSDGTNLLVDGDYNTKDTLLLSVSNKKIVKRIEYKVGNLVMIIGGKHTGEIGTIKEVTVIKSSKYNTVKISGEYDFETIEEFVMVIGETESEIELLACAEGGI